VSAAGVARPQTRPLSDAELGEIVEIGRTRPAADLMASVDRAAQRLLGHKMLTVMRLYAETMELERVYSNLADAYPSGGRKSKRSLPWAELVLVRGEVFMGSGPDQMSWAFDDHRKLAGLGLGAIINTPVLAGGRCLGTLNILHEAGWYRRGDERITKLLAYLLAPALLSGAPA
jgi:hypothetical protein